VKAVILAGGLGTRISEETSIRPKPLIEIGGKPLLWHIMKILSTQGINEFIVCLGYKGHLIKEYFLDYNLRNSNLRIDVGLNKVEALGASIEDWKVTLIETGNKTGTGGRLKRISQYLGPENFLFTYGDGLCDINLAQLVKFHNQTGALATVTAVQPPGRYGNLIIGENKVTQFEEKSVNSDHWVSGGFFILDPKVLELIAGDTTEWEEAPLRALASNNQMFAYKHNGFWHSVDTLRDKNILESLWESESAPWKLWN
jgi:glucose-1-phosphate cytidylyltransferase